MPIHHWGVLGASDALMQGLPCLSFMLLLLAYYCTHYAISDRRYLESLGYFEGLLYVNAEAGTRQTSRCIHSRSSHPCIYTQILVPRSFNQTPPPGLPLYASSVGLPDTCTPKGGHRRSKRRTKPDKGRHKRRRLILVKFTVWHLFKQMQNLQTASALTKQEVNRQLTATVYS